MATDCNGQMVLPSPENLKLSVKAKSNSISGDSRFWIWHQNVRKEITTSKKKKLPYKVYNLQYHKQTQRLKADLYNPKQEHRGNRTTATAWQS